VAPVPADAAAQACAAPQIINTRPVALVTAGMAWQILGD
jgi:hypothetical protein